VTALGGIDVTRTWQLSGTHLRTPEGQHCLRFLAFHASLLDRPATGARAPTGAAHALRGAPCLELLQGRT